MAKQGLSIEIKGVNKTIKGLQKFGVEGDKIVEDLTEIHARDIAADAKRLAPVDTGKLQQNIPAEMVNKFRWMISAIMHYARYVELGTTRMAAQPFLHPAWRKGIKVYLRDLNAQFKRLTKKYNNK